MRDKAAPPGPVDPSLVRPATGREARAGDAARTVAPGPVDPARVRTAAPEAPAPLEDATAPGRRGPWRRVLWSCCAFLAAVVGYNALTGIAALTAARPVAGGVLAALGAVCVLSLGVAAGREWLALRRLDLVRGVRARANRAIAADDAAALRAALRPALDLIARRRPDLVDDFRAAADGESDCRRLETQFRRRVLAGLDREARQAIRTSALQVAAGVAVCPHPALDLAVVAWRALALIRRISEIYGVRASGAAALRLLRLALVNAGLAAGTGWGLDAAADALGQGLAQQLGRLTGEAGIAGYRAVRLGLVTMALSRPLPLQAEETRGVFGTLSGS